MSVQMIGAILDAIWQTIEMVIIPSFYGGNNLITVSSNFICYPKKNNYYPELF